MRLALYQPDIPQNTGTILRLAACFAVPVDIIGPAGFDMTDKALRRAGLDYLAHVTIERHESWETFEGRAPRAANTRVSCFSRRAALKLHIEFRFAATDILMMGRESAGVPDAVHAAADARVRIPIQPGLRSLNIAVAAAIALAEALRQTDGFPVPSGSR